LFKVFFFYWLVQGLLSYTMNSKWHDTNKQLQRKTVMLCYLRRFRWWRFCMYTYGWWISFGSWWFLVMMVMDSDKSSCPTLSFYFFFLLFGLVTTLHESLSVTTNTLLYGLHESHHEYSFPYIARVQIQMSGTVLEF